MPIISHTISAGIIIKKKILDHLAKRRCEHWRLYPIDYLAHVKSRTLLSLTENICLLLSLTVSWEGETGASNLSQEGGRELMTWYAILFQLRHSFSFQSQSSGEHMFLQNSPSPYSQGRGIHGTMN